MTRSEPLLAGIRHVCFDKDGVLTDVHPYWAHTCRLRADALVRALGLPDNAAGVLLDKVGIDSAASRIKPGGPVGYKPRSVIITAVLDALASLGKSSTPEAVAALFKEVDARQQEEDDYRIEILPGVEDLLTTLKGRGISASIYSSDRKENLARILAHLSLSDRFQALVGGGCVEKPKPHPEGFLKACEETGSSPSETAYIGDTVDDMRLGRDGGARTVLGVSTGLGTPEELRPLATAVLKDLTEVTL